MKQKKRKKVTISVQQKKTEISPSKKKFFWGITLAIPLLLFIILEISLRIFNYGGNLELFVEGPPGYEDYLRCNLNVARRYFYNQQDVPTLPLQLFRKEKSANTYRIFVLGESSTAGFPYSNNAAFPNILRRGLQNSHPEKEIEVINIAMAAVNSYTLLDLLDEIIEQFPDVVLIYTGHNEYYGALGVGSVQSLGNWRWLIKTYLNLQSFKTFLLLRDFLGWTKLQLNNLFYKGNEVDPSQTLMASIVGEQTIPYKSELYEAGKIQFEKNLEEIIIKCSEKNIPVILSELVSNLKDQKPFISVDDNGKTADKYFNEAREFEEKDDFKKAKGLYIKAKDYDALRFRAPEEFNEILNNLSKKFKIPVVKTVSYFEDESENGLIGSRLMLEHLHPNKDGYFLIAKAFYDKMKNSNMIDDNWNNQGIAEEKNKGITELDSVYASLVIKHLKSGWPFKSRSLPNKFLNDFKPQNLFEELAFRIFHGKNYNLESAHMELGEHYEKQGEYDKSFEEYFALITSIPTEIEFYKKAANVLLKKKEYEKAKEILTVSLKYKEDPFAYKWIGQINLMNENYDEAINFLTKADMTDPQVVFNLSRAYYFNNEWYKGEEYFNRLKNLNSNPDYISHLNNLRISSKIKGTN